MKLHYSIHRIFPFCERRNMTGISYVGNPSQTYGIFVANRRSLRLRVEGTHSHYCQLRSEEPPPLQVPRQTNPVRKSLAKLQCPFFWPPRSKFCKQYYRASSSSPHRINCPTSLPPISPVYLHRLGHCRSYRPCCCHSTGYRSRNSCKARSARCDSMLAI